MQYPHSISVFYIEILGGFIYKNPQQQQLLDLDDMPWELSCYRIATNTTGLPTGAIAGNGFVAILPSDNDAGFQILGSDKKIWIRMRWGTFSEWLQI